MKYLMIFLGVICLALIYCNDNGAVEEYSTDTGDGGYSGDGGYDPTQFVQTEDDNYSEDPEYTDPQNEDNPWESSNYDGGSGEEPVWGDDGSEYDDDYNTEPEDGTDGNYFNNDEEPDDPVDMNEDAGAANGDTFQDPNTPTDPYGNGGDAGVEGPGIDIDPNGEEALEIDENLAAQFKGCNWPGGTKADKFFIGARKVYGITFAFDYLWAVDSELARIYKLDPQTGATISYFDSPAGNPTGITADATGLYIASPQTRRIYYVDPADGKVVRKYYSPYHYPTGLAFDGKYLWNADYLTRKIYMIDITNGRILKIINTPGNFPKGLQWYDGSLYIINSVDQTIYQLNPKTGAVVSQILTPGDSPRGIAMDGTSMFCSDAGDMNRIYQILVTVREGCRYILSYPMTKSFVWIDTVRNLNSVYNQWVDWYIGFPPNDNSQSIMGQPTFNDDSASANSYDKYTSKLVYATTDDLEDEHSKTITMSFQITVFNINFIINPDFVGTLEDVPSEIMSLYTEQVPFWMQWTGTFGPLHWDFSKIRQTADNIVGNESNIYLKVVRIHDWLARSYMHEKTGWYSAYQTLYRYYASDNSNAILFVALLRSLSIPARYVGGSEYIPSLATISGDYIDYHFYRWVEVYIPLYGWIPFDAYRDRYDNTIVRHGHLGAKPKYVVTLYRGGGNSEYMGMSHTSYHFNEDTQADIRVWLKALWAN